MEEVIEILNNRFIHLFPLNLKLKDNKITTFIEIYHKFRLLLNCVYKYIFVI